MLLTEQTRSTTFKKIKLKKSITRWIADNLAYHLPPLFAYVYCICLFSLIRLRVETYFSVCLFVEKNKTKNIQNEATKVDTNSFFLNFVFPYPTSKATKIYFIFFIFQNKKLLSKVKQKYCSSYNLLSSAFVCLDTDRQKNI